MAEVTIRVRKNGPYQITGAVNLTDHEGNAIPIAEGKTLFLCRCGHSSTKPICDGTHKTCGFVDPPEGA